MTKPKKDIKFQHRERRTSRGSNSDSPTEERMSASGMSSSANGFSKSPTRNGDMLKQNRADAAAGWATDDDKPPVKELSESEKKKQTFITRTIWTIVMIAFFFGSMFAGHIYMLIIVTAVQIISYKEVIAIANVPSRARSLRFTKTLNWYFLGSTMYFLYGESVIYYFKHIVLVDKVLLPFATHHRFISFMLYVMGFVFFVGSLQKGHYKFQFTQFAWTHMALYLIVVQAHFIMNNIFEGMIWFFLPVSLVITNDIFAYICGITFGRTQLIKISPKKTVEGFVGAWVFTVLFGFAMTNVLMRSSTSSARSTTWGPTSSLAWNVTPTRSLSRTSTSCHSSRPTGPTCPLLSASHRCNSTSLSWRLSHRSSRRSVASSPLASSAHSTSRTLVTQSPATAV